MFDEVLNDDLTATLTGFTPVAIGIDGFFRAECIAGITVYNLYVPFSIFGVSSKSDFPFAGLSGWAARGCGVVFMKGGSIIPHAHRYIVEP